MHVVVTETVVVVVVVAVVSAEVVRSSGRCRRRSNSSSSSNERKGKIEKKKMRKKRSAEAIPEESIENKQPVILRSGSSCVPVATAPHSGHRWYPAHDSGPAVTLQSPSISLHLRCTGFLFRNLGLSYHMRSVA